MTANIIFDGNSITAGNVGTQVKYPDQTMSQLNVPSATWSNQGVGGLTISEMLTRAASVIDPLYVDGKINILCTFEGVNDLQRGGTPADLVFWKFVGYCMERRARGWKVIAATIPACNLSYGESHPTSDQCEARRLTINALMRLWKPTYCDQLVDLGSDSMFGSQAAADNTTYYQDHLHPTTAGNAHMASLFVPKIQALL